MLEVFSGGKITLTKSAVLSSRIEIYISEGKIPENVQSGALVSYLTTKKEEIMLTGIFYS